MKKDKVSDFQPYSEALRIDQTATLKKMVELFLGNLRRHHLCVVNENNQLIGLINRKRLFQAIFSHHVSEDSRIGELFTLLTSESAGDLMVKEIITVRPEDPIDTVIETMIRESIYELPVIDEQKQVLGFIDSGMFLEAWLQEETA